MGIAPPGLALQSQQPSNSEPCVRQLRVTPNIDLLAGGPLELNALNDALHPQESFDKPDFGVRERLQATTVRGDSLKALGNGFTEHRAAVQPFHEVWRVLFRNLAEKPD